MFKKIIEGLFLALCAVVGVVGVLGLFGAAIEGMTDWQVEHERCLKRAPNVYESQRCR